MDNLTHGLCGALVAELWLQFTPRELKLSSAAGQTTSPNSAEETTERTLTYAVSIAANNLPDLDIAITGLTAGPLGSLLHHRGHTHTLLGALALALAFWGAVWFCSRRTARARKQWYGLGLLAGVGVLLHLLLDSSNNYGVHPFWPFDKRWYYGDLVFIIEPWWWSVPAACLASIARSRGARIGLGLVWVIAATLAWPLPLPIASGIYGSSVALIAAGAMAIPWLRTGRAGVILAPNAGVRTRLGLCFGLLVGFHVAQWGLRDSAEQHVRLALASESAPLEVFDTIASPAPATPWCWDFLIVGAKGQVPDATYVIRIARSTALPDWFAAASCPLSRPAPTAPLTEVAALVPSPALHWDGEYRLGSEGWSRFAADCTAQAFLRFARAPFFVAEQGIVGDLRYDRGPDLEFAELRLPRDSECPERVPDWEPPRNDVSRALSGAEQPAEH